jgi:uncharacterized membrane protein (DUF106 family)
MKNLKFISIGGLLIGLFFGYQQYTQVFKTRDDAQKRIQEAQMEFKKLKEDSEKSIQEAQDRMNHKNIDTIKK